MDLTVEEFLNLAGVERDDHFAKFRKTNAEEYDDGEDIDHVVELQLVVEALNAIMGTRYTREGWATDLADFFNRKHNLQFLDAEDN